MIFVVLFTGELFCASVCAKSGELDVSDYALCRWEVGCYCGVSFFKMRVLVNLRKV